MKNYYLFLLTVMAMFSFNQSYAQFCPPTGFTNGTSLYFFYDAGGVMCGDRPNTISVGASEFTMAVCESGYSIYDLTSGAPVANINYFIADFGIGTCEYTNGDLTEETLSISQVDDVVKTTKVFPNPLTSGNSIHLIFSSHLNGKVNVYDVTGKIVLSSEINNLSRKEIDASSLANGVYLLKIDAGSSSITKKVIIMK
ncbi:hypothetical protein DI383_07790 [Flavobacteriaceae bacterium LYZ1037]|nr:hypothetical protein DI383_07790 [Flavobacteriaceae bacterium LYZ1037]